MPLTAPRRVSRAAGAGRFDDQEQLVGLVAAHKRATLLRAYRDRLPLADLEDCYSQATLELLLRARLSRHAAGAGLDGAGHVANALEQKLRSRIQDRRRAIAGRSAMAAALAAALPLGAAAEGGVEPPDARAGTEERVASRLHLRALIALARRLSFDQRLLLACRLQLDLTAQEFCERFGWSLEKYRKVDQRARARLRVLAAETLGTWTVPPAVAGSE